MAAETQKSDVMKFSDSSDDHPVHNSTFSPQLLAAFDPTEPSSTSRLPRPPPRSSKKRRFSLDKADRSTLDSIAPSADSEAATQNVAPYLAKHIPIKYNVERRTPSIASTMDRKPTYCNRHRPDTKCWRQANEPTMDELQNVCRISNIQILLLTYCTGIERIGTARPTRHIPCLVTLLNCPS
jgi:hypothetical protein